MRNECAVFVFAGFLGAGKTTALQGTLQKTFEAGKEKALILCTEDGEEEYLDEVMQPLGISVLQVEEEEDLTSEYLRELAAKEQPDSVYIEFNGMWDLKAFLAKPLPEGWYVATVFSLVDATTYDMYLKNLRQTLMNPLIVSDVILFNRVTPAFRKEDVRAALQILNRQAEVYFTREDGSIDDAFRALQLPEKDGVLQITDENFCAWFVDCVEHTDPYYGKKVSLQGMVMKGKGLTPQQFYFGRYAAICCAEDAQFIGFVAQEPEAGEAEQGDGIDRRQTASAVREGDWIEMTATITKGALDGNRMVILLQAEHLAHIDPPEDIFLYFA